MAPILTFTSEEAWGYLPGHQIDSVHLELFPEVPREWLDERLERQWERLLEVRREVAKALESARQQASIGSSLEARVVFVNAPEDLPALIEEKRGLLSTLFIVSQVGFEGSERGPLVHYESQEIPGLIIDVERALGRKCERCWVWSERVGEDASHPTLCERCVPVIARAR